VRGASSRGARAPWRCAARPAAARSRPK
jgi:hypothetical protein